MRLSAGEVSACHPEHSLGNAGNCPLERCEESIDGFRWSFTGQGGDLTAERQQHGNLHNVRAVGVLELTSVPFADKLGSTHPHVAAG